MTATETSNPQDKDGWPRLNPMQTGVRGHCPRCGKGHIFEGFLKMRKDCEVCGLSYDFADPADGPAFFVMCFGCIPAVVFALVLQVKAEPPFWVHLFTSVPLLILTCLLPLRPLKGWLVCSQYFYQARPAQLVTANKTKPEEGRKNATPGPS